MKNIIFSSLTLLLLLGTINSDAQLKRYNVLWDSPSQDSWGSMPIGNGDIGANLWVNPQGEINFYISKTDAWSENARLLKIGKIRLSLEPNPFMEGKPFVHEFAFADMITNFIFHDEFIKIFKKIINQKGVINIGGKTRSVYDFARKYNPKIKKIYLKKNKNLKLPINSSMNLSKLNKILKKK